VLLHGRLLVPIREGRGDLLGGVPEPGDRRERQDEPRRAGRPLSVLLRRAELGPELLLAAHADPHDRLTRCRGRAHAVGPRCPSWPSRSAREHARAAAAPTPWCSSTTASGSRDTARSSTTWSAGSGTRATTRFAGRSSAARRSTSTASPWRRPRRTTRVPRSSPCPT